MKKAAIIVPGLHIITTRQQSVPCLGYEQLSQGALWSEKSSYRMVKPYRWNYFMRGWLPSRTEIVPQLVALIRRHRLHHPLSRAVLCVTKARSKYWQALTAELANRFDHQPPNCIDWPLSDTRWAAWFSGLLPGDLLIIDDSTPAGQKLSKHIMDHAPEGVAVVSLREHIRALCGLSNQLPPEVLAVGQPTFMRRLAQDGLAMDQIIDNPDSNVRREILRSELALSEPDVVVAVEPVSNMTNEERWQSDDHLTRTITTLHEAGYDVAILGAPLNHSNTKQLWPFINWRTAPEKGLPPGWQREALLPQHAKRLLWRHIGVMG